jgi:hypothetical protein
MPHFDVVGEGIKTNRRRHKRYLANDEHHVRKLALQDDTRVITITLVEPGPPTEKQLAYARDLGLSFSSDVTINEMGNLLSRAQEDDTQAPRWLIEYWWSIAPVEKDMYVTQYAGFAFLIRLIHGVTFSGQHPAEMVRWFIYFVVRDRLRLSWEISIDEMFVRFPLDPIKDELVKDPQVLKSIKGYTGLLGVLRFGEYRSEDGAMGIGGSKRTIAYTETLSRLQAAEIVQRQPSQKRQSPISIRAQDEMPTGCLGLLVFLVLIPVMGTSKNSSSPVE